MKTHTYKNQKEIFRLWFEFLKRAYDAEKELISATQRRKMLNIYADWGDVGATRFDSWWKVKAEELFREPDVELLSNPSDLDEFDCSDYHLVLLPKNLSMQQIRIRLDEKIPSTRTKATAKFSINTSSKVHAKEGLRYALRVYDLLLAGKSAWEVFDTIEREDLSFNKKWSGTKRHLRVSSTAQKWRFRQGVDVRTPSEGEGYYRIPQLVSRNKKLAHKVIASVVSGKFPA